MLFLIFCWFSCEMVFSSIKTRKWKFPTLTILKLTLFFWEVYVNILTIFKVFINCSWANMLFFSPTITSFKTFNWTFYPTSVRFINSCKLYSLKYDHFPSIWIFWSSDWIKVINTRNNIKVWITYAISKKQRVKDLE